MRTLTFNKQGYDPFLDFIKVWAILCVLFGHTFPYLNQVGYSLWFANQVPLFILIQAFHCYKKDSPKINYKRILSRVMIPFLVCEVIVFSLSLLTGNNINSLIFRFLSRGGYGPGAYYPWIYLQMAIILPLIYPIIKKVPLNALFCFFLLVCEGFEVICSLVDLPDWIYRLLAIRYFFLIFLALQWLKKGIVLNKWMIVFSLLSMATIVYFRYLSINDEPWFYNTAWKTARWPCYYYVANLYVYFLYLLWTLVNRCSFASRCIKTIASSTYEIFLVQMSVIYLFHVQNIRFVTNSYIQYVIWMVIIWVVSLGLGIMINKILNRNSDNKLLCTIK